MLPGKCSINASSGSVAGVATISASELRPQIPKVSLLAELKWFGAQAWQCWARTDRSWSKATVVS